MLNNILCLMIRDNILSLAELTEKLRALRSEGNKVVHCHGCFDIVHIGHVKHFQAAKALGDVLIVTVTPDRFIQKGPGRPFFPEQLRLEMLAAIDCIDYVALTEHDTALEAIRLIKPHVYVKGKEVLDNASIDKKEVGNETKSHLQLEQELVEQLGGKIHLTEEATFSSSTIINQFFNSSTVEAGGYLTELKKKYTSEHLVSYLDSLQDLNVLVIGDAIIDEYVYCTQMEKSGKDGLIGYKYNSREQHAGGILAIANHVAHCTPHVTLLTTVGYDAHTSLRAQLDSRIVCNFLLDHQPTLLKTRYVDEYRRTKLFELYNTNKLLISPQTEQKMLDFIKTGASAFDLVIVADFGHGCITPAIRQALITHAPFLAVNTQLNSGNFGYNFITQYPKADFISINERELRLPMQEEIAPLAEVITKVRKTINVPSLLITRGKLGSTFSTETAVHTAPVLTRDVVDIIGAGDAVLSITALLARKGIPADVMPFMANCVGALAVRIMGNRHPVRAEELRKFIHYILK